MSAVAHIDIVIPARNEEARLANCLTSVAAAIEHAGVPARVLVVLDLCTDDSIGRARDAGVDTIVTEFGAVGAARAAGALHVLAAGRDPARTWLACTDADSVVPVAWLTMQVMLAATGVDCVIGTVEPRGLTRDRLEEWRRRHHLVEGHPHVHGANLGVRASAYLTVGGFAPSALHEDVDLVTRLRAGGHVCVSTDLTRVLTSGRTRSHVTGGFATYLAELG